VSDVVLDEKGLRLAREVRKALREREENEDLAAALEVYDRAVTPAERQAAASYLLEETTRADKRYGHRTRLAFIRMVSPELLDEGGRR
jgi:hypothetical protein